MEGRRSFAFARMKPLGKSLGEVHTVDFLYG